MSTECPKDKIFNPKTGRCVKKDGAIGKKILAQLGSTPKQAPKQTPKQAPKQTPKHAHKPVPKQAPVSTKKCKDDEILNSSTNRCVKRNGAVGKKILAQLASKSKQAPLQAPKQIPKQAPKQAPKQIPKQAPKQAPKKTKISNIDKLKVNELKAIIDEHKKTLKQHNIEIPKKVLKKDLIEIVTRLNKVLSQQQQVIATPVVHHATPIIQTPAPVQQPKSKAKQQQQLSLTDIEAEIKKCLGIE